ETAPPAKPSTPPVVDAALTAQIKEKLKEIGEFAEKIYELIPNDGGISCDDIAEAGVPIADIMVATARMEMEALIEILPGGQMKRKQPESKER
ncbi:MAG: hypothetical protein J6V07_06910, partial [Clostridia bacterium]|nr:hypothetical protein [Clostridia bacterium]